ncbi:hypothetical protein [Endozoicomonas elysicola]|uniref:Uncharacterized protein n=1 Tax=Endozoicomonas elysicola TaxID=305900 RepID=A0A081KAT9_9GAMM|nr:hypothetical protein [Endozoicomonas elysicola]KEI71265.1 hypothetical protein GV64_11385 [Endozoicomonas elysicola]
MDVMLIFLTLLLMPVGIFHLNAEAAELFRVMEESHYGVWVSLGSPKRLLGIVNGAKEPAFSFVYEKGYESLDDSKISKLCHSIDITSKVFVLVFAVSFILASIWSGIL